MGAPFKLPAARQKELLKAYKAGESPTALAERFGVHRTTVVAIVRRLGGPVRGVGGVAGHPRPRAKTAR